MQNYVRGHRSNALFKYEKSSVQQQMMVSNLLGPPVANLTDSASTNTPSTTVSLSKTEAAESNSNLLDLESLDFDVADELLANMTIPDSFNVNKVVMSGSVFNNCTFHF